MKGVIAVKWHIKVAKKHTGGHAVRSRKDKMGANGKGVCIPEKCGNRLSTAANSKNGQSFTGKWKESPQPRVHGL